MTLEAADLEVGYGGRALLPPLALTLVPGTLTTLLGPNGGGKSTLLRSLLGIHPPVSGRITLGGVDLATLRPADRARHLAFMPQEEAVPFPFTALEFVTLGRLAFYDGLFEGSADREAATAALRRVGAEALASRPVTQLSGGERQRVRLARAFASGAPYLLLDEPSAHLDPRHTLALADLLLEEQSRGVAIVAALHDLSLARALGGNAILIGPSGVFGPSPLERLHTEGALRSTYGVEFSFEGRGVVPVRSA